jgi:hypothetical protein
MNLQDILFLANRFPVFPCHWADGGACSCGDAKCISVAKHPLTRDGVLSATQDPDRIAAWHARWPNANWAVACGGPTRLLAVDIDPDKGGEATWRDLTASVWPDCPTVRTGSGGYHYYLRVPDGVDLPKNSASSIGEGVDIRSQGGYVIAPGSRHRTGGIYEWAEFEDEALPDAPAWLIARIAASVAPRHATQKGPGGKITAGRHDWVLGVTEGLRAASVPRGLVLGIVREMIPDALDLSDGREVSDKEILDAYDGTVAKRGDAASPEDIAKRNQIASALIKELDDDSPDPFVPTTSTLPADLYKGMRGPLRALFEYALDAPRPQPELAMAAALTTFGAVLGSRVETRSALRTNLYLVGICDSGGGKDEPRKACKKALRAAGLDEWIGADYWASSTAIHSLLQDHPTRISYVDEFGKVLAAINNNKAGTHLQEITRVLLMLFGAADSVYDATAYADKKKNIRIEQPNLSVFGTSTYGPLFASLSRESIEDGLLARCLFVAASNNLPFYNHDFAPKPVPLGLIEALKLWKRYGNDLGGPVRVYESPEAAVMLADYRDACDDKRRADPESTSIFWTRSGGHAAKLALVHACGGHNPADADPPVIGVDSVEWAIRFVNASTQYLIDACGRSIAESSHERILVDLERYIASYGADGISKTDLRRGFRRVPGKQLFDCLAELHEQGRVAYRDKATGGRPTVYIYASKV